VKKKLFIIDGHALCYRAYYAFINNPLINSKGQNISAIYGFTRMFFRLLEDQKPDYLIAAFDPPGKTFRSDIYSEYKANRKKMPEDLRPQVDEIKNIVESLGFVKLEHEGLEADDLLGSAAQKYASKDLDVYLVTGDKDAYQLVTENVRIYANKKGISEYEIYGPDEILEKIGLPPEKIIDYMALTGDTSDNIPGAKGIGPKSALKLMTEFGSVENIYDNIGSIKGKVREKLESSRDMVSLSKQLVTIKCDVTLEEDLESMKYAKPEPAEAAAIFRKLEMDSVADEFFGNAGKQNEKNSKTEEKTYSIIRTEKELQDALDEIKKAGEVSVDTETTSVSPVEAELIGISMSIAERQGWYLPVVSRSLFSDDIPDRETGLRMVRDVLENPDIKKIGQNIKYDLIVLSNAGIELKGIYFDTMIASYLLDPTERRHNLDLMASKYLNYKTISYKELTGTGKNAIPLSEVPIEGLAEYAIEDADIAFRLYSILKERIVEDEVDGLFYEIEMPLVHVLADMEKNGVKIDPDYFTQLGKENDRKLGEVMDHIYSLAGETFNLNSTRELAHILFEKIGLKPQKKTKTGYSTDIKVLEALKGDHEIIDQLISYRTLSKLKSTYIDALPKIIYSRSGRIHTSYNQTVVATGRLSSSDPNLQNIPVRDEFGKNIRKGFVPEKGFLIMSADYSQIELRLAAHLSGDENMCKAFTEGIDIHSLTASSVFGVSVDDVTSDMRRQSKIINFATIYGVSPYGLSQQADIGIREAGDFIRIYFETYPGFKNYMDETIAFARENRSVRTMHGRKRIIPEIDSETSFRREGAERIAINTPIQGTSADMIKIAMIGIHKRLKEEGLKSRMIMQVHDELVFEVHGDEKDIMEKIVREGMEKAVELRVPVVVDIGWGKNWEEAH